MQVDRVITNTLEAVEASMLNLPQVEIPVTSYFTSNGLYAREITIPAGTLAVGHAHNHEFMEVFMSGILLIPTADGPKEIHAPFTGIGKPNTRKLGLAITDCRWVTFHSVPEGFGTVEKMEELIINKSDAFKAREKELICQSLQQLS